MDRTTWLQERRMQKFCDVLSRWEAKRLSALKAAEILGMSERTFRRYRQRYETDGLESLVDRRLGKVSVKAVPVDEVSWMLEQYRTHHEGWTVKHFHEQLRRHLQARQVDDHPAVAERPPADVVAATDSNQQLVFASKVHSLDHVGHA